MTQRNQSEFMTNNVGPRTDAYNIICDYVDGDTLWPINSESLLHPARYGIIWEEYQDTIGKLSESGNPIVQNTRDITEKTS